ncbi:hypothetical protein [Acrocarpospora sp. B8E8]|uniref:hypothetical protein n=1 Tax=Acrocarpospora sp. B8E8 TaxID=3153572 RepID=UPI00325E3148
MTTTATEAIGDLLQELTEAWNDGDAERYASAFTEDADPTRNSVISLTAVLTEVGWRFASFQNTRVSDPKAAR